MFIIYRLFCDNNYYSFIGQKKIKTEKINLESIKKEFYNETKRAKQNIIFKSQENDIPLRFKVFDTIGIDKFHIELLEKIDTDNFIIAKNKKIEYIHKYNPNMNTIHFHNQ